MITMVNGNHTLEKHYKDSNILFQDFFSSHSHIREEQEAYRLELAVPGMTRHDISIRLDGVLMQIQAAKRESGSSALMQFQGRHFRRSFTLPEDADINNIKAKCRNGLLTINIGKIKAPRNYRVIKVGGESSANTVSSWWSRLTGRAMQLLTKHR